MFDRAIIETDKFLSISLTAKALYFLLGMEADDEGFVSPNRVIRLYGGEIGDLRNLIDTGLIIPFQSGVVVITDWKKNNWLDDRRVRPTEYQKEKSLLLLTEMKRYELSNGVASTEERRVEQSSTVESRTLAKQASIDFEEFWKLYPKKVERKKAELKWSKLSLEVQQRIIKDIPIRLSGEKWKKNGGQYIENPTTYLNGERWNDEIKPFIESEAISFKNKYIPENI